MKRFLILTCCGAQRNNRRGLDLETAFPAVVVWTGWELMASVSNSVEESVGHSEDGILPSPRKRYDPTLKLDRQS